MATGIEVNGYPDDPARWTRVSCEIALDPVWWSSALVSQRCEMVVHEAGHLAMLGHTEHGVMMPTPGYFAACHPVREQAAHAITEQLPKDAGVTCGRWQGRAFSCVARWVTTAGNARVARYRVRTRGTVFAITRRPLCAASWVRC